MFIHIDYSHPSYYNYILNIQLEEKFYLENENVFKCRLIAYKSVLLNYLTNE